MKRRGLSNLTSTAVMQRRVEPHDSLDDFPTPPWAVRALCEFIQSAGSAMRLDTCREPAANRGHMVRPLREYFGAVEASDIHDYGAGFPQLDYLFGPAPPAVDWTITNPPFRLAEQFVERALATSRAGVAIFARLGFLEGRERLRRLYRPHPPSMILQFAERVVLHKGKLVDPNVPVPMLNKRTGKVEMRKPSSATAYCWIVWERAKPPSSTSFVWLEPCRARLERPGDYASDASDIGPAGAPLLACDASRPERVSDHQ